MSNHNVYVGMTAPQAAGVIHSDFEKGFIRAETVSINDNREFYCRRFSNFSVLDAT